MSKYNTNYIHRDVEDLITENLGIFPVVLLEGARQVGKSTTVRSICDRLKGQYITLDDVSSLNDARLRPKDLLAEARSRLVVIDEIQRVPELLLTVKLIVDEQRRNGMFLLTGSADRYKLNKKHETLAGRKSSVFMHPLSQTEIGIASSGTFELSAGLKEAGNIIDAIFAGQSPEPSGCDGLPERVSLGGYPAAVLSPESKMKVMHAYLDVDLIQAFMLMSTSEAVASMPIFMRKLAGKMGKFINVGELAKEIERANHVSKRLVDLLGNAFLLEPLPSLGSKFGNKKIARKPKVYLNDSGMSVTLLGLDGKDIVSSPYWGTLLETFIISELRKHLETSSLSIFANVAHYSEHNGIEVDAVINDVTQDQVVAVEVKAGQKVRSNDLDTLDRFRRMTQGKCKRGILVYTGDEVVKHNEYVEAWPASFLWNWRPKIVDPATA